MDLDARIRDLLASGRDVDTVAHAATDSDPLLAQVASAPAVEIYDPIGETLSGRYRVLELLGQGGMGRVYEADDLELRRRVAIKLVRAVPSGLARAHERLLHEGTVTANLEHPSIVPVYDAGVAPNGEPFFVMRRARGERLDRLIARADTPAGRLALIPHVAAAAEAVAFAHAQGIVHGDLKPSNVLIGESGETLVADWGLARHVTEGGSAAAVGTPAYMAPEQVEGHPADERCDVYALGATLFHVLAGMPAAAIPPPDALAGAPVDAIAVARKALAHEPSRRYPGAAELACDLRRLLAGQPVSARRSTRPERLQRWARAHRSTLWPAAALSVVLGGLLALVVATAFGDRRAASEAAERARRESGRRDEELLLFQARTELLRDPTAAIARLQRYPASGGQWEAAAALAADAWSRGVARDVWALGHPIGSVAFSPDGRTLAAGARDGTLTFIDLERGSRRAIHADRGVGERVVFSADGAWAATSDGCDETLLWNVATGASVALAGYRLGAADLRFAPDGTLLATRRPGGPTRLWQVPSGAPLLLGGDAAALFAFPPEGRALARASGTELALVDRDGGAVLARTRLPGPALDLVAAPDGAWLAALTDGALLIWRPASGGRTVVALPAEAAGAMGLLLASPDGRRLIGCDPGQPGGATMWVFDVQRGAVSRIRSGERCARQAFVFSPDGAAFASAGLGSELRVHDVADGRLVWLRGHDGALADAAFAPDGRSIASASFDGTVRLWRWGEGELRVLHDSRALDRPSATGQLLVADPENGAVALVDLVGGGRRELGGPRPPRLRGRGALARDGSVAAFPVRGALRIADLRAGTARDLHGEAAAAGDLPSALAPDGASLALVDGNGVVRVVDLASGRRRDLGRLGEAGLAVTWSGDGRRVAAAVRSGAVRVLDVAGGADLGGLAAGGEVGALALAPDGGQLAAAGADGTIRVLALQGGATRVLHGHAGLVTSVELTPDGRGLLSAGADGTVRSWALASGAGRVVRREPAAVTLAALSTDGALLVTATARAVRLADARALPPPAASPPQIAAWIRSLTSAGVDSAGRVATP